MKGFFIIIFVVFYITETFGQKAISVDTIAPKAELADSKEYYVHSRWTVIKPEQDIKLVITDNYYPADSIKVSCLKNKVDVMQLGSYPVTFSIIDPAGNANTIEVKVWVVGCPPIEIKKSRIVIDHTIVSDSLLLVKVNAEEELLLRVSVINNLGQEVLSNPVRTGKHLNERFSLLGLQSGTYHVQVVSRNDRVVKKFVIE